MVLQKYGLTVDAQERDVLEVALSDCESADLLIYVPQAGLLSGIYATAVRNLPESFAGPE